MQFPVACEYFVVQFLIHFHAVILDERLAGGIVAFALDALDFMQHIADQAAQLFVVGNLDVGLAVALDGFVPHGGGAHPQAELPVERAIDDHILQGFAVLRKADDLVFVALEVAVAA